MENIRYFIQSEIPNTDKKVLVAVIPFVLLKDIATSIQRRSDSDSGYYQRGIDDNHLNEMVKSLRDSVIKFQSAGFSAIYPTSMVIAMDDENVSLDQENFTLCFSKESSASVVDGQHRLASMSRLYEDCKDGTSDEDKKILAFLNRYLFNCTVLFNFDLWEQSLVFADINFKQKKVNKSLYYDIYGTAYSEVPEEYVNNYIYVSHEITKRLNTQIDSPLSNQIKMLGVGAGVISQAFMVENISAILKRNSNVWNFKTGNKTKTNEDIDRIYYELKNYFYAVKKAFHEYWNDNIDRKDLYILKTPSMYAFLNLVEDIHNYVSKSALEDLDTTFSEGYSYKYIAEVYNIFYRIEDKSLWFGPGKKITSFGSNKVGLRNTYECLKKELFDD